VFSNVLRDIRLAWILNVVILCTTYAVVVDIDDVGRNRTASWLVIKNALTFLERLHLDLHGGARPAVAFMAGTIACVRATDRSGIPCPGVTVANGRGEGVGRRIISCWTLGSKSRLLLASSRSEIKLE